MATGFRRFIFSEAAIEVWEEDDEKHGNWPAVYVLDDGARNASANRPREIYVGESRNVANRLRQHLNTPEKQHLRSFRVILDERYNKSVCLDLESYLIKMLAGDGSNRVLNRNNGMSGPETRYYQCEMYRDGFRHIFDRLRADGLFTRTIPEIENSDLFKLSPFKTLTEDQANSVDEIVRAFLAGLENGEKSMIVIQGDPGTGKTITAIYLIKLLRDIGSFASLADLDNDARFSEFFTAGNRELLRGRRIGLVVPQQSLRASVEKVFANTAGLEKSMVLTPFEVGESQDRFDLLLVDETHRLNQRANQASANQNTRFGTINTALFGNDELTKTQLDWIRAKSNHVIFLVDAAQSVRPADLSPEHLAAIISEARASQRHFRLRSQMRVRAGDDFVAYIRWILDPNPARAPPQIREFGDYDFRLFDDVALMRAEIVQRDAEVGLSRMAAGFAFEWKSKKDKTAYDIEIGETRLRWNSKTSDWISSANALEEVGSIHTVQGYDLNYLGVIIGPDLRNNPRLGLVYTDDDLLRFITQIYAVLLTRGIRGTYVYACDEDLRSYLQTFIPRSHNWGAMDIV
ncbi:hypothetical protein QBC34DRAFT_464269 [Podospora aff. communis PSN243]|uniref:GIY-YIG domain-containing protein n=1 Tax=Podospora aff. communis PSN243 TaxID=3040156 RepID=A0AAV9GJN7_9PEZI|nr:hypothetical protein QBC34DRAFT_464269 [Podospora aff. communis PSN243]